MDKSLKVTKSITINSKAEDVWDALTNPTKIKVYLFGTNTVTDWKPGSSIVFSGEYDGHKYTDKGNVLENHPNQLLKYSYWSGFSGLEDKEENYSIVSYEIEETGDGHVKFRWTQEGFASEEGRQHTENGLFAILEQIKKLVEKGYSMSFK